MAAPIIWLEVTEQSIDIASNTSQIVANLYLQGNGTSWNHTSPHGYIMISGAKTDFYRNFDKSGDRQWLGSAYKTVTHNSDGSLYVNLEAGYETGGYYGTLYASTGYTATTIPRTTKPTTNKSEAYPGDVVTISLPRASDSFLHRIWYRVPGESWVDLTGIYRNGWAQTYYNWTVPTDIVNSITNSSSAYAEIWVDTYNYDGSSDTFIGTDKCWVNILVPENLVPTINALSVSEDNVIVKNNFKSFVQTMSRLKVSLEASSVNGATIRSKTISIDGVTYGNGSFINDTTLITNSIKNYGELTLKATVIDTRGRTAEKDMKVLVQQYFKPRLLNLKVEQCTKTGAPDPSGSCSKVTISGEVCSVSNENSKVINLKYKKSSDPTFKSITIDNGFDWNFTTSQIIQGTEYDVSYDYEVYLSDDISTVSTATCTGKVVISRLAGGNGVTFFKEAVKPGLWIKNLCCSVSDFFISKWKKRIGKADVYLEDIIDKLDYEDLDEYFKPTSAWTVNRFHAFRQGNCVSVQIFVSAESWQYNTAYTCFTSTLPKKYCPDGGKPSGENKYNFCVIAPGNEGGGDLKCALPCTFTLDSSNGNIGVVTPTTPWRFDGGSYFWANFTYDIG